MTGTSADNDLPGTADAVNKSIDVQGLDAKDSVRVATDGSNVDLSSSTDPNPIDGVTLSDGDRVLLKDQSTSSENGIYVAHTATNPTSWKRADDMNEDDEISGSSYTFVDEGTNNSHKGYLVSEDDPVNIGDSLTFSQFTGAGQITAGDGLTKSGDTIDHGGGSFLTANADTVDVNLGNGLEGDGSNNVRVRADQVAGNVLSEDGTNPYQLNLNIGNGVEDNSGTLRVNPAGVAGDGLKETSATSLGVEPSDFAGTAITDDGSDNLQVSGPLTGIDFATSGDTLQFQEDGNNDLIVQNTTDGVTLITVNQDTGDITYEQITGTPSMATHDHSESGTATVPNAGLTNDTVTVTAGDGLKNGGGVALGGTITLDVEPDDFAGTLLSDDGSDNLQVDEGSISHDGIDQTTVTADDHHTDPTAGTGITDEGTNQFGISNGGVGPTQLSNDAKQAVNTATIPNTEIGNTNEAVGLRMNVPSGKTLKIWALGVQNDSNSTPTDLDIRVRDETNGTNIVDQNQAYNEGTPIASKSGAIDVSFKVMNDTGSTQNASGWVSWTVEG